MKVLFIPYSEGIYVPFTLHQYQSHELEQILKTGRAEISNESLQKINKTIKPSFFLDMNSLTETYQTILKYSSLLD